MIKPSRQPSNRLQMKPIEGLLNPVGSRQTIADDQAAPEFQENLKRLRAERLAREAGPATKPKG